MVYSLGCLGRSVAPEDADECRRFNGLKNQGNTCHLNVILQALYMTPELRQGMLEASSSEDLAPLPRSLATLFNRLSSGERVCSTAPITKTLRGHGMNRQQDCHDTYAARQHLAHSLEPRPPEKLALGWRSTAAPRLLQRLTTSAARMAMAGTYCFATGWRQT